MNSGVKEQGWKGDPAAQMNLFEYSDYKKYVRDRVDSLPQGGRGQYRRISEHLRMHTSLVSQIFRGPKDLTPEQAALLCSYLGLTELESQYFLGLVDLGRAGSRELRRMVESRLGELRERASQLANRLPQDRALSDVERAVFYSRWTYSAVRLLTSVEGFGDSDAIARHLGLSREAVASVLEFLLTHGLCVRDERGQLRLGAQRIHLPSTSPLVAQHHRNWRLRAMDRHEKLGSEELAFSAPLTISREDFARVREKIVKLLEEVSAVVEKSEAQELACFNIDWVRVV